VNKFCFVKFLSTDEIGNFRKIMRGTADGRRKGLVAVWSIRTLDAHGQKAGI
jgi:hypothetical protein